MNKKQKIELECPNCDNNKFYVFLVELPLQCTICGYDFTLEELRNENLDMEMK